MSINSLTGLSLRTHFLVLGLVASAAGCGPAPVTSELKAQNAAAATPMLPPVGQKVACAKQGTETAGQAFVRVKVRHLRGPTATDKSVGFDYESNGYTDPTARTGYRRPDYDDNLSANAKTALADAFNFLRPAYQSVLCTNLDFVFVDDNAKNFTDDGDFGMGWAFWEVTAKQTQAYPQRQPIPSTTEDQADGLGRFIALPNSLLTSKPSLQELLVVTLNKLLSDRTYQVTVPRGLVNVVAGANTTRAALAAVMLHELGHVLWFQTCVADGRCTPFRTRGWKRDLTWPSSGIHNPKDGLGAIRTDGTEPGIAEVVQAAQMGNFEPLYALLGVGNSSDTKSDKWVTLLSAGSPDEDFADTLSILGLQQHGIRITYRRAERPFRSRPLNGATIDKEKVADFRNLLPTLFTPR